MPVERTRTDTFAVPRLGWPAP